MLMQHLHRCLVAQQVKLIYIRLTWQRTRFVPENKVMGSWWTAPKPWSPSDSGKYILLLILHNSLPGEPQISTARHGTDQGQ